jgi:hypothetical protein
MSARRIQTVPLMVLQVEHEKIIFPLQDAGVVEKRAIHD